MPTSVANSWFYEMPPVKMLSLRKSQVIQSGIAMRYSAIDGWDLGIQSETVPKKPLLVVPKPVLPQNQAVIELRLNPAIWDWQKVPVVRDWKWLDPGKQYLHQHPQEVSIAYSNQIPALERGKNPCQPLGRSRIVEFLRK